MSWKDEIKKEEVDIDRLIGIQKNILSLIDRKLDELKEGKDMILFTGQMVLEYLQDQKAKGDKLQ